MSIELSDYWAIQKLEKKELVEELQDFWDECLANQNDPRITLTPRWMDGHVSIRYCGLEVLQVSHGPRPRKPWQAPLYYDAGRQGNTRKIRRSDKAKHGVGRDCNAAATNVVKSFVKEMVDRLYTGMILGILAKPETFEREESLVPGFGFEHWLESIVLANTDGGKRTRARLGLPADLGLVVTQVPVILRMPDGKHTTLHIDVAGVSGGMLSIVELKVDDDIRTARTELTNYCAWAAQKSALLVGKYESATFPEKKRGSPKEVIEAKFLPPCGPTMDVRLVGVVDAPEDKFSGLTSLHGQQIHWMRLAPGRRAWLKRKDGYPLAE